MSTTAEDMDFDWMDDTMSEPEPRRKKKRGPPKGTVFTPEHMAKLQNNGRKKGSINVSPGKYRDGKGNIVHATLTPARWRKALELIANGTPQGRVSTAIKVSKLTFHAYLISNVGAEKALREARLLWYRRDWSPDEIDAVLSRVSMGETVKAACEAEGFDKKKTGSFYTLMRGDKTMRENYDIARQLQAESWLDDNIDISDDKTADRYIDAKGNERINHEVMQRSKLRIETRQWTMGVLHRKRFGDHKHVDHGGELNVNHSVMLAKARKRLESTKGSATIDNTTQQIVSNEE